MNSPVRILHVDDDPEFAALTAEFLEREDDRFSVTTAEGPQDGRHALGAGEFDCVVSDFDMPGGSGLEFLETVRADHPDLPFILFTGKGSEEVASDAISAGVTDYLQKAIGSEQYELLANRIATAVDQRRTARELDRQNDLFAKAQNIGNVGAWEYDIVTDTTYVSDEVLRIHGLDTDDHLTPAEIVEYVHPDDRTDLRVAFRAAVDEGTPYDLELRLLDAGGTQRWVRIRGEPQAEDGDVVRVRGILQDITDQKHRERELQRQNARLEEFASVVSHDIRNPLQVASGHLELAAETGDASAFEGARDALDRIESIVENILALARHGRSVDGPEPVELSAVAREAWATVETGELELTVVRDTTVSADRDRLRQLFENLFRNTVEHGRTGPDSLAPRDAVDRGPSRERTRADDTADRGPTSLNSQQGQEIAEHGTADSQPRAGDSDGRDGATAVRVGEIQPMHTATRAARELPSGFYVADDGPGIRGEIRDDVLESGFTTAVENTGFGLAIVAQIAEAHDWEVTVCESRTGGARFEFTERPV